MPLQSLMPAPKGQAPLSTEEVETIGQQLGIQLATYLFPLLVVLDRELDKRLVRTFLGGVRTIITFRDRMHGLLLSEMGAYLLSPEQERAGTRRLANVLHSPNWSGREIDEFLWSWAITAVEHHEAQGQDTLVIWDERVWEKPESQKMEDLGPVRSSKAHRLTRTRRGFTRPPRRPIFVPGLNWLGLIVVAANRHQKKTRVPLLNECAIR